MEKRICSDGVILVADAYDAIMDYATGARVNRTGGPGQWQDDKHMSRVYPATKVRIAFVLDPEIVVLFARPRRTESNDPVVPGSAS